MNDKFTIRDFFAYFFCGFAFIIAFSFSELNWIILFIKNNSEFLKNNSTVIIFFCLPFIYFIGQMVQTIDTLFYEISLKFWQSYVVKKTGLKKFCYWILAKHRISGNLNLKKVDVAGFWKKCDELEMVSKYGRCEYWYIMNDLYKGISLFSFGFSIFNFCNCHYFKAIIFLLLTALFWLRAKYFAVNFINGILSAREALNSISPENVKT